MEEMESMGEKLKKLRIEKGLSRREVDKLVDISPSTIGALETGKLVDPKISTLKKLSACYGVKTTDLMLGL